MDSIPLLSFKFVLQKVFLLIPYNSDVFSLFTVFLLQISVILIKFSSKTTDIDFFFQLLSK